MADKREQFEILSRELLGRLNDVNRQSDLFFPFDYFLPEGVEEKFFPRGAVLRGIMIRNMIIIDNSFKKFKIFPSHDIMVTYIETQKDILKNWKEESLRVFMKNSDPDKPEIVDELKKTLTTIEAGINKASMAAIKEVGSSEEAKMLDVEYNSEGHGIFKDFIHNTIMNLFK